VHPNDGIVDLLVQHCIATRPHQKWLDLQDESPMLRLAKVQLWSMIQWPLKRHPQPVVVCCVTIGPFFQCAQPLRFEDLELVCHVDSMLIHYLSWITVKGDWAAHRYLRFRVALKYYMAISA
jgi:hypothetical protein